MECPMTTGFSDFSTMLTASETGAVFWHLSTSAIGSLKSEGMVRKCLVDNVSLIHVVDVTCVISRHIDAANHCLL